MVQFRTVTLNILHMFKDCLLNLGGVQAEIPAGIQLFHLYCTACFKGHALHFMKSKRIFISPQKKIESNGHGCCEFKPEYWKTVVERECCVFRDDDFFLIFVLSDLLLAWFSPYPRFFCFELTACCTKQYQPQHFSNKSHFSAGLKLSWGCSWKASPLWVFLLHNWKIVNFSIAVSFSISGHYLCPNHSLCVIRITRIPVWVETR